MTVELEMLALSIVLGLVHIIAECVAAHRRDAVRTATGTSARAITPMPPLVGRCGPAAAGAAQFHRDVCVVRRRGA